MSCVQIPNICNFSTVNIFDLQFYQWWYFLVLLCVNELYFIMYLYRYIVSLEELLSNGFLSYLYSFFKFSKENWISIKTNISAQFFIQPFFNSMSEFLNKRTFNNKKKRWLIVLLSLLQNLHINNIYFVEVNVIVLRKYSL